MKMCIGELFPVQFSFAGFRSNSFRGISTLHELQCSAETLASDLALMGITVFIERNNKIIAYINVRDNECSTSDVYSACVVDKSDFRKSKLITLVADISTGETRSYGCNLTSFRNGQGHTVTWFISVHQASKVNRV